MPRRKSLVTVIRDIVQEQVQEAIQGLLGSTGRKKKAANGRRRRKARGKWRPGGPGRPPKTAQGARKVGTARKRRRARRPPGSKTTRA